MRSVPRFQGIAVVQTTRDMGKPHTWVSYSSNPSGSQSETSFVVWGKEDIALLPENIKGNLLQTHDPNKGIVYLFGLRTEPNASIAIQGKNQISISPQVIASFIDEFVKGSSAIVHSDYTQTPRYQFDRPVTPEDQRAIEKVQVHLKTLITTLKAVSDRIWH